MEYLKCKDCKYEIGCPAMYCYLDAECKAIQKPKEEDLYQVNRDEYVGFIGQLNKDKTEVEQYSNEHYTTITIVSKKTGKNLCSRVSFGGGREEYYIFEMPEDDERITPKPIMKVHLDTLEQVQAFFTALGKAQKEIEENAGNIQ